MMFKTSQVLIEERVRERDAFISQEAAERAYFRVLSGYYERGTELNKLQHRIGRQRQRLREINRAVEDFMHGVTTGEEFMTALGYRFREKGC